MVQEPSNAAGLVFDVQRFSLHDGPGIRTTVFVKGCPLRCMWCHNPESARAVPELAYLDNLCAGCRECERVCRQGVHRFDADGRHTLDRGRCEVCGACAEVCVAGALKVTGERKTAHEVMQVVLRDMEYYKRSGGGLTVSGGEPLICLAFTKELLRLAKEAGVHTCIETLAAVPADVVTEVAPFVDLFLIDWKASDPQMHQRLTGQANEQVLRNIDMLYQQGKAIRLRCPLVPGVNDTPEHLAGIAALSRPYPRLEGLELMPYHNIGNQKYGRYAISNPLPDLPNTDEATKQAWLARLAALGCDRAVIPG